jgi:hypothetical protein
MKYQTIISSRAKPKKKPKKMKAVLKKGRKIFPHIFAALSASIPRENVGFPRAGVKATPQLEQNRSSTFTR